MNGPPKKEESNRSSFTAMEFTACAYALSRRNLSFVEFAWEFCGLAVVMELHDTAILHLFRLGANYQHPMDLPDTTGLCWREGIYRCLGSFRSRVETSPLVSPLSPLAHLRSGPSSSSSSPLVLPSSSSLVPPSSSSSLLVPSSFALPECPLVPLGLLVDYEGMVWSPALEPALHLHPPVPAPRQCPPVPAPRRRPPVPASCQRPPVPTPRKCSQVPPLVLPSSSSSPLVLSSSPLPPLVPSRSPFPPLVPSSSPLPPLVPSSSPLPLLVPSSSPSSPLAQSSSALPERPQDSALPECPRESALPERPQELFLCSSPWPLLVPSSSPGPPLVPSSSPWPTLVPSSSPWPPLVRPAHLGLRWSRPAHLCLRWSRPAHLGLRWPCPAHLPHLQSAPQRWWASPIFFFGWGRPPALSPGPLRPPERPPPSPFDVIRRGMRLLGGGGGGGGGNVRLCLPLPCVFHAHICFFLSQCPVISWLVSVCVLITSQVFPVMSPYI